MELLGLSSIPGGRRDGFMTDDDNIREIVGHGAVSAKTRGVEWVDRECYFMAIAGGRRGHVPPGHV